MSAEVKEWNVSDLICNIPSSSPFYGVEKEVLERVFANVSPTPYKKGEFIFLSNMKPVGVFYLCKGKVKIYKKGNTESNKIVRLAKEGDILGYRALLANETYQANAEALEDCMVCFISKENFFYMIEKSTTFAINMLRLLAENLKEAENSLLYSVNKSALAKTAEALLMLYHAYGDISTGKINVELKRAEISDLAGLSLETTIRSLAVLRKNGIISIDGRTITINDIKGLENVFKNDHI